MANPQQTSGDPAAGPAIGSPEWIAAYSLSGRTACRKAQLDLARVEERLFSLEGDLGQYNVPFHREFPDRFLQIGIAEGDLVGAAVGLAMRGKIPFVNTFAAFLSMRACEQVRFDVACQSANVKLVGYVAGLSGCFAGSSHHCIEDMAILRAMPNLVILSPADAVETYKATWAAAAWDGPVYLRVGRADTPQVYFGDYELTIGKVVVLAEGDDLAILATGNQMVAEAVAAAKQLGQAGIGARVLNVHTVQPLDREAVLAAAATGAVVTVEDHNVLGGLGGAVAELLAQEVPVPVVRVGVEDRFCETVGPYEEMVAHYGLDAASIAAAARRALERKRIYRQRSRQHRRPAGK
ncbi:MAG TPA: transketolase C-terminal domain-containing protein [Thermoanaerobaculia bacterium]|nr:transketolase C-terminal domain-containing protein [Thermoanaerobaculia bacterium]